VTQAKQNISKVISAVLYQAGIALYAFVVQFASLFNPKARLMIRGQRMSFDIIRKKRRVGKEYVWFHAASLGEFEQGRPVMEALKRNNPGTLILLTFFSPSGYEIRKNYHGADIIVYLPFDTKKNAEKLLNNIQISKAIFIKYEFWPNYLKSLSNRGIPVYSVSAIFRPQQALFKPYGKWYLGQLSNFRHIFVQDVDSEKLLRKHGIQQVSIAGDTRFDRVLEIAAQAKHIPLIEQFVGETKFTLVAGSTWPPDEELLIRWMLEHPENKLIIVPHEIHESHIQSILSQTKEHAIRYTQADENSIQSYRCMILDTMGMLSSVYRYGQMAYIGGGFGAGIHNTLEAAVWGIPVVFGPNYEKFREAGELVQSGGAFSIKNYSDLIDRTTQLKTNRTNESEIAGEFVRKNAGATGIISSILFN
jgi:3-deoxy-D-manno-octulosonic-acid transferase